MTRNYSSKQNREPTGPAMVAWHVSDRGKGRKGFWTRVGAAWKHEKGEGLTLFLDLIPVDGGRLVLLPPRAGESAAEGEPQEAGTAGAATEAEVGA